VQLDYVLPERFGLQYTGPDNQSHRPVLKRAEGSLLRLSSQGRDDAGQIEIRSTMFRVTRFCRWS